MKLKTLGENKNRLELDNGTAIYFSYSTPVAAFIPGRGFVRTAKKWSVTTSKHIGVFARDCNDIYAGEEPQEFFDNLVK